MEIPKKGRFRFAFLAMCGILVFGFVWKKAASLAGLLSL
jgi:hypothetical protein